MNRRKKEFSGTEEIKNVLVYPFQPKSPNPINSPDLQCFDGQFPAAMCRE